MNETIKLHLQELYKRQENEKTQLATMRLLCFDKGEYSFAEDLQQLEDAITHLNLQISGCLREAAKPPNSFKRFKENNVD